MRADALLTQDELDFIRTMQHSPQPVTAEPASRLLVNGGTEIKDLLTQLIAQEQVTLQAQFENQQMTFPLQLVEDEFHSLHLQLGAPNIYEEGPMVRPLAADPGDPGGAGRRAGPECRAMGPGNLVQRRAARSARPA